MCISRLGYSERCHRWLPLLSVSVRVRFRLVDGSRVESNKSFNVSSVGIRRVKARDEPDQAA